MNREQWLDSTVYQEFELCPLTNREVIGMLPDYQPVGWINPFEMTAQQLDDLRENFDGNSLEWSRYVERWIPFWDPKEERRKKKEANDLKAVAECGTRFMPRLNKQGMFVYAPKTCNRYHLCPKCRMRREQQHFERLMKLDGRQVIEGRRAEMAATYSDKYPVYSFKLTDGREVTVIDTDEPIGGAKELNYEIAKEYRSLQITGTKVSGKAGLPPKELKKESQAIKLISPDCETTPEIENKIEQEYLEATKDFESPSTIEDAIKLLLLCQSIWFAIIRKYVDCDKIHFTERYNLYITQDDLDWSGRSEKVQKRLQWLKNSRK